MDKKYYVHLEQRYIITLPYPNSKGDLFKPPLKPNMDELLENHGCNYLSMSWS